MHSQCRTPTIPAHLIPSFLFPPPPKQSTDELHTHHHASHPTLHPLSPEPAKPEPSPAPPPSPSPIPRLLSFSSTVPRSFPIADPPEPLTLAPFLRSRILRTYGLAQSSVASSRTQQKVFVVARTKKQKTHTPPLTPQSARSPPNPAAIRMTGATISPP